MAKNFGFIILSIFMISCGNSNEKDENENASLATCDCGDLLFDPAYNNFYTTTPREGYTGACEEYFGNGQLALIKHFKSGKVDGAMKTYYENGQLNEDKFFEMNFQQGDFLKYNENGKLIFHGIYERGQEIETVFIENGD